MEARAALSEGATAPFPQASTPGEFTSANMILNQENGTLSANTLGVYGSIDVEHHTHALHQKAMQPPPKVLAKSRLL